MSSPWDVPTDGPFAGVDRSGDPDYWTALEAQQGERLTAEVVRRAIERRAWWTMPPWWQAVHPLPPDPLVALAASLGGGE